MSTTIHILWLGSWPEPMVTVYFPKWGQSEKQELGFTGKTRPFGPTCMCIIKSNQRWGLCARGLIGRELNIFHEGQDSNSEWGGRLSPKWAEVNFYKWNLPLFCMKCLNPEQKKISPFNTSPGCCDGDSSVRGLINEVGCVCVCFYLTAF